MLAQSNLVPDVRLAAALLLVFFAAALAVLMPRELRFLASVEPDWKRLFIIHDLAITGGVLLVLVPPMLMTKPQLTGFVIIAIGFTVMWGAAIWAGIARYLYVYRILLGLHRKGKAQPPAKPSPLEEPHDK